jgi:hypothetical protein
MTKRLLFEAQLIPVFVTAISIIAENMKSIERKSRGGVKGIPCHAGVTAKVEYW